ncbi:MAG: aldo/keto reductase [Symploca sp. SIO2C1]|nr:aldo/keto reductase [Symploca sp. SIO2C1]
MTNNHQATALGTDNYCRHQNCAATHFRDCNQLLMSSIGIGTYLGPVDEATDQLMHLAIINAIANGINVVDTAINYRHQRSERVVGQAIEQVIRQDIANREGLIICSKGGFIPHPNRVEWFKKTYVDPPGTSICMADLAKQRHCMHPDYIRDQLNRSLDNLGVETIDIYYLHNPEDQLSNISRESFYQQLKACFTVLEEAVEAGKIGAYGLATWDAFRVTPNHKAHIDLAKAQAIAQSVSHQGQSHFKFIQLPLNLLMLEGATLATQTIDGCQMPVIEAAQELKITTVASAAIAQGRELEKMLPLLTSKSKEPLTIAQQALQFTRSIPGISTALVGMKKPEHVAQNLELASLPTWQPTTVESVFNS